MKYWLTQDSNCFGRVWIAVFDKQEPSAEHIIQPQTSQPKEPLMLPSNPEFHFQKHRPVRFTWEILHGVCRLVYWLARGGLIIIRPESYAVPWGAVFFTYNVPNELSSNSGPLCDFYGYNDFLSDCDIKKWISSASKQWVGRINSQNILKNADRQHWCSSSHVDPPKPRNWNVTIKDVVWPGNQEPSLHISQEV